MISTVKIQHVIAVAVSALVFAIAEAHAQLCGVESPLNCHTICHDAAY